jgi:hypothetical protein
MISNKLDLPCTFGENCPKHVCVTHYSFCAKDPFEVPEKRKPRAKAASKELVTKYQAERLLGVKAETVERAYKHGLLAGQLVNATVFYSLLAIKAYLELEPYERKRLIRRSVNNDGYAD